jgi:hypothetical protein
LNTYEPPMSETVVKSDVFKPIDFNKTPSGARKKVQRGREPLWDNKGRLFLKGPVSIDWIAQASALGKAATSVGLECWYRAGLAGSLVFRLNLSRLAVAPKLARSSARHGLQSLEGSDLVSVARPVGQRVLVAIKVPPRECGANQEGEQDLRGEP